MVAEVPPLAKEFDCLGWMCVLMNPTSGRVMNVGFTGVKHHIYN